MRNRWLALFVLFFSFAPPSFSERPFPVNVKIGELSGHQYPQVQISGKTYSLAPGAKIFSQSNLIIMPVTLPASAPVAYTTDTNGQLSKVWLITPEEAAKIRKSRN